MSTFTNITVSDTVTADTIVCDSFVTNSALSATSYGGVLVNTNTIIPYTGNTITINGPTAGLDTLDINSRQVLFEGNANITGTTFTNNINAGLANITAGNLVISNNINSLLLTVSNLSMGNVVTDINILGTTTTRNINAGTSNITAGNILLSGVNPINITGNINCGNLISDFGNLNTLFIGSSASYTPQSGIALAISQNTTFDNTVNGAISGNVYPQFSFGAGREHQWAIDAGNNQISYYGITSGGAPDSDFMITYKNSVGMKISPVPSNTDFNEALRVVGSANISGNCQIGNLNILGTISGTTAFSGAITGTSLNVSGNVDCGNLNVNVGNLYMQAVGQSTRVRELWYQIPFLNGIRSVCTLCALNSSTVASGNYLSFGVTQYMNSINLSGGVFSIPFTGTWTKLLKIHLSIKMAAAMTINNATLQGFTGTTNTMATTTAKTIVPFYDSSSQLSLGQTVQVMIPLIVDNTQPFFSIKYTGAVALQVSAGVSPTFASFCFIEEMLCA